MSRIRTVVSFTLTILMAVIWTGTAYAGGNAGANVYARSCAGCHGTAGKGDGAVAGYIYSRPRNFTLGEFKFGGTPDQIARTVQRGLPGTAMPAFASSLSNSDIKAVSAYVRRFASGSASAYTPPSPQSGSAARGASLFADACVACHGTSGRGDGPSSLSLEDEAGNPVRPRNLVDGAFAGGDGPKDIYTRLHQGIPGTPMPAFGDTYSSSQLWDLVAFVKSLRKGRMAAGNTSGTLSAERVKTRGAIAWGIDDPAWANAPVEALELHPLWRRSSWPASIKVRALANANAVAFLLSWPDAAPNQRQSNTTDFLDAVAVMVPENASSREPAPFIGMGAKGPQSNVRILQWRALSGQKSPSVANPRLYRNSNPWEAKLAATPARAAGNPISDAATPAVLEYVASGAGTLTNVPGSRTLSEARWKDGQWQVFIARPRAGLPSLSKSSVWAAFAVWDGSVRDRNGQKSITKWIHLNLGRK